MGNERIKLSGGFCIMLALMLLLVPIKWLAAAMIAAVFHELCHYLAIRACCGACVGVKLYAIAAYLPLPRMSRGREVVCALAGPIGGLCLLSLARWMPRIALCAAMQSAYNLLPIYPLDGGRALQSGLLLFFPPPISVGICRYFEILSKMLVILLAVYGCFVLKLGIFPLLMALLLLIRVK